MTSPRVQSSPVRHFALEPHGDPGNGADVGEINENKTYNANGGGWTMEEQHRAEIACVTDLKTNFKTYDVNDNGYLERREIQWGLKDKFSEFRVGMITENLVVLQATDFVTNEIPGKTGYGRYLGLSRDDIEAIEDRLIGYRGEYGSLFGTMDAVRDNEVELAFYIPTYDAEFEGKVETLAAKLNVFKTDQKIPGDGGYIFNAEPASHHTKRIIAREILKLYVNKEELIQEVLDEQNPSFFISSGDNKVGGRARNEFLWEDSVVFLDLNSMAQGHREFGYETIVHEFSHLIDFGDHGAITTDKRYIKIRDDFFERAERPLWDQGARHKAIEDPYWKEKTVVGGIPNYAFYGEDEFFAETMELFKEDPQSVKELSLELYNLYVEKLGMPFENKPPT